MSFQDFQSMNNTHLSFIQPLHRMYASHTTSHIATLTLAESKKQLRSAKAITH